jgi:hypothetical protein
MRVHQTLEKIDRALLFNLSHTIVAVVLGLRIVAAAPPAVEPLVLAVLVFAELLELL